MLNDDILKRLRALQTQAIALHLDAVGTEAERACSTLRIAAGEAVREAGGVRALADALMVTPKTLWLWGVRGTPPSRRLARDVNAWARRRGLVEPFGPKGAQ